MAFTPKPTEIPNANTPWLQGDNRINPVWFRYLASLTANANHGGSIPIPTSSGGVIPGPPGEDGETGIIMLQSGGSPAGSSGSWIPLSLGVEPLQFVSDGAGSPVLVWFQP